MIFQWTYDTYKFAWWWVFLLFELFQIWRFPIRKFSNFDWLIFCVFRFWNFACLSWKTTNCRIFLEPVLNWSNFRQWALKGSSKNFSNFFLIFVLSIFAFYRALRIYWYQKFRKIRSKSWSKLGHMGSRKFSFEIDFIK